MKKFLAMYMFPIGAMDDMMKNATPEQQKAGMEDWKTWMGNNKDSFTDMGGGLGKNTRVTSAGATDERNEMGGYSIMQGESKEALVEVLKSSPHFKMSDKAYIEVMEIMGM